MMYSIFLISLGFVILWLPLPVNRKARRQLERLEALEAGAEEAFFDEHRTLIANTLTSKPLHVRVLGVALMIMGFALYFGLFS